MDPDPEPAQMFYLIRFILLDISWNRLFKILKSFNNFLSYGFLTFFTFEILSFSSHFLAVFYTKTGALKFSSSSILCLISVWMVQTSRKTSQNIRSTSGSSKRHQLSKIMEVLTAAFQVQDTPI